MKLITLNIWGGKVTNELIEFVKKHTGEIDIFCFQEVFNSTEHGCAEDGDMINIHSLLRNALSGYTGFHEQAISVEKRGVQVPYGLAMFAKESISIKARGAYEIFAADADIELPKGLQLWNRLLQYMTITHRNTDLTIFNLHGIYTGGGKGDNSVRIEQSTKVRNFMARHEGKRIICGDFNLNPETESLKILGEGMRNLIQENGITSTRSHHYKGESKFADYMFATSDIEVKHFEVLADVVSDHSPLLLEFA